MLCFVQLLLALRELHRGNLVHGDVRTAKVLLKEFGGMGQFLKLRGVSRAQPVESPMPESFGTKGPLPPPELKLEGGVYSQSSDIWSLGVILYHMVMGRVPTQADIDALETLKSLANKKRPKSSLILDQSMVSLSNCPFHKSITEQSKKKSVFRNLIKDVDRITSD